MRNKFISLGITSLALCLSQSALADGIYTIYPVPQQQVTVSGSAALTPQVNVIVEKGIDEVTRNRLVQVLTDQQVEAVFSEQPSATLSNLYLGINGSGQAADQMASTLNLSRTVFEKQNKYDRHCVSVSNENGNAQILILGENTDAAFYGLASLEQMLEEDHAALPCIKIYDYADQKSRGIVEGYYGYPYTVQVKKDLMRYMMRFKMNTYMYGAKSDPYHSQYWKNPYPTSLTPQQVKNGWLSQDMIKDITQVSHATKVNFIWAIHPGNDIIRSGTVVKDVMSKFDKMYQLGVRQFAVFVDDVGVPSSDSDMEKNAENISNIQHALEEKYNQNYTSAADTVKPLHFVPQVYCSAFAQENQRKRFFKALSAIPSNITLYTTGWGVWSVPNQGDFNLTASEFGRPAAWWWNYPCNDNADAQIYPMDMYSNFVDMPAVNDAASVPTELTNGLGIVCNPMQQGEISKIPLFSTADYAWNTSGFNNMKSWSAAFPAIVGKEKAAALQLLAKYLRKNDPSNLGTQISQFKQSLDRGRPNTRYLNRTLGEVYDACLVVESLKDSEKESDRLLYNDLAPWLLKLKQMTQSTLALLDASTEKKESDSKWSKYVKEVDPINALDTAEVYKAYALEGMGNGISVSVRQAQAAHQYLYPFTKYMKEKALGKYFEKDVKEMCVISNLKDVKGKVVLVNDSVGLDGSIYTLQQGDYVGFALAYPRKLADVAVADTLAQHLEVLYSDNGKQWINYGGKETFLQRYVKYLCVKNTAADPVSVALPIAAFSVTLGEPTALEQVTLPEGPIWNEGGYMHDKELLIDGDYSTYTCLYRCQQDGDKYTVELNKVTPIHDVRICMGTTNGDHMNSGYVEVSKDGSSWKKIYVKGTSTTDFTINMPQAVQYSNEMKYCDFDGKGIEGKYVRFCLKSPRTDKWLRFYEIEVNKQFDNPVASATIPNGRIWQNHNKEYIYDGNPSTFVCLDKNQNHGDTYSLQLKKPMKVEEVRVYMGTTNGDHMNKGNIEVSKDGHSWTQLLVKGTQTADFTMEMPETVKYNDEVYYCDFTGIDEDVKFVRFVVKDARTNKWLRLYEIAINPNRNPERAACETADGSSVTTLDDALGYTGIEAVNQSLTYFFTDRNLLQAVEIYQNAAVSADAPATIQVTSDGEDWKDYGALTADKQVLDLTNQSDAIAMKLSWKGMKSPAIYEIVPVTDGSKLAEVTKVENVITTDEHIDFAFNGRLLTVAAAGGIASVDLFGMDGKTLLQYQAAGAAQVKVPVAISQRGTYLVRVVLQNGASATYKVYCR